MRDAVEDNHARNLSPAAVFRSEKATSRSMSFMELKDLLVVCHARSGLPAGVNVALLLAQAHDAHITAYHLAPDLIEAVTAAAAASGAVVPPNIAALERDQDWLLAKGAEAGSICGN